MRNNSLKIIKIKLKSGKILEIVLKIRFQASKKRANLESKATIILIFGNI